ncbi:hypothetical protein [Streptomyces sp. IB2014 016-6]|uniref:hypothetical protein n=1 Tax=Streptomyces sp. IB2014 016-6 TaxID=2517818 RepID=UPI0011C96473|nr:hypothetical protein [Streptomyces sp. IB2014 016-6]TXL91628.1 hypothetical protein EW053_04695 [Streptomyces sp. IB2014 016-6]
MTDAQQFAIVIVLVWLACLAAAVNLCRAASQMADDQDDSDSELTQDVAPPTDPRMETLLAVQAGLDAAARELDPDLTICRELYPDAPAWPDAHTPAGEDGTS